MRHREMVNCEHVCGMNALFRVLKVYQQTCLQIPFYQILKSGCVCTEYRKKVRSRMYRTGFESIMK